MTACAYRIPDTAGGEHDCGRPAHAVWRHADRGEWPLCRRHDLKAQGAVLTEGLRAFAGWKRTECPQSVREGQGAPEAAGALA